MAREGVKAQSVRTGSPGTPRRRMQTLGRAEGPRTGRPSQGLPRPQTQAAARSAGGLGRSGNVQSRRLLLPSLSPSRPSSHKAHSFARRGGRRCTKDRSVPRHPPPPPAPRDADRRPGPTGLVRTRSSQRPSGRRQGRVRQTPPGTAPDAEHQRQEADTRLRPRRAWLSLWLPRSPSHRHRTGASRHQCDQFHIPGGGSAARHPAPPGDESRLARSGGASGSEKAGPAWLSQAEAGRTAVP